jgi:excisionase family DNA binding protein
MALVTVRTAAERLGVAYSTLKRWVHTGHGRMARIARLPPIRERRLAG